MITTNSTRCVSAEDTLVAWRLAPARLKKLYTSRMHRAHCEASCACILRFQRARAAWCCDDHPAGTARVGAVSALA